MTIFWLRIGQQQHSLRQAIFIRIEADWCPLGTRSTLPDGLYWGTHEGGGVSLIRLQEGSAHYAGWDDPTTYPRPLHDFITLVTCGDWVEDDHDLRLREAFGLNPPRPVNLEGAKDTLSRLFSRYKSRSSV